jgi:hypothetical protein
MTSGDEGTAERSYSCSTRCTSSGAGRAGSRCRRRVWDIVHVGGLEVTAPFFWAVWSGAQKTLTVLVDVTAKPTQAAVAKTTYGWTGHKSSSGFSDLAPSILHYNWF